MLPVRRRWRFLFESRKRRKRQQGLTKSRKYLCKLIDHPTFFRKQRRYRSDKASFASIFLSFLKRIKTCDDEYGQLHFLCAAHILSESTGRGGEVRERAEKPNRKKIIKQASVCGEETTRAAQSLERRRCIKHVGDTCQVAQRLDNWTQ